MGKVIVITGAGSGLGRALANRLGSRGHRMFLLGRNPDKLEAVAQTIAGAQAVTCDVANSASVKNAFTEIAERVAPSGSQCIDVLINNAGRFEPAFIGSASDEHIQNVLNTNLTGTVFCSRTALALMGKGAHILNIGSETVEVPVAMLALYQASKAGLERFTKTLNQEASERGIRVTMIRAGKMYEPEMASPFSPEIYQQFSDENARLGFKSFGQALSHYASVADVIAPLLDLPSDVNVPHICLEGRFS